ncbi:MAG: hypothetical protein K2N17_00205, partial [Clostridia bacterium]|nr:hypothetical protein [Clostridia bacterium]
MQEMNTSAPTANPSITKATKGKGQVVTFKVAANTTLTIDATGETPQVIRNDGKVYLEAFSGSRTVMLDAGTYMVCSGKKDKEITINSLSVQEDSAAAKEARIAEAKKAIEAIPNPVTRSSGNAIEKAKQAYANLITEEEKTELGAELKERLSKAQSAYETVLVEYAIARIEYIGTVTEYSSADIQAAATAYKAVSASAQSKVTNYAKLTAAQDKFAEYALTNLQNEINRLPLSSSLDIVDSKVAVELAISLYEEQLEDYSALEDEDKAKITVTNVNASLTVLRAKLAEIVAAEKEAANLAAFNELLAATTAENVTLKSGASLKAAYESLTAAQKNGVSADDKTKYDAIIAKYNELQAQTVVAIFARNDKNKPLTELVPGNVVVTGNYKDGETFEYNGETYSDPLKMESSTNVTITLAANSKVKLKVSAASKKIKINGTDYTSDSNGFVEATVAAGTCEITKGDSINLCYIEVTGA